MASIQFTGLASGLDTDSMVQAMLLTQQNKIDSTNEKKELLKWKQDEWKKVNDLVNDFYKNYAQKLQKQATFYSYTTSVSNDAVSAATSGSMSVGTHTFTDIKTAKGVSLTGKLDDSITSNTKSFKELGLMQENEKYTIEVNTKNEKGENVKELIEVSASDSVSSLENKLEQTDSNLKLNFDFTNHKTFISSTNTGKSSKLDIKFEECELFKKLGFTDELIDNDGNTITGSTSWNFKGEDGSYKYNGVTYTSEKNDIEVNGIKVTLQRDTIGTTEKTIVNVKSDSDALVSFMKEFVDEYNKLMDTLNKNATKVSTKMMTDAEKQNKTDKQIDEYEQNIKDSLLRRDDSLGKIISTLRDSMQSIFSEGKYKSLSAVGITTGSYSENGKLIFDDEGQKKFRECVETNLEDVIKLFTATDSTENTSKETKTNKKEGLGTKLYKNLTSLRKSVQGLKSFESYYNDKLTKDEIKDYESKVKELKKKYTSLESMYKKKFSAMEKALSQINSQSASFMSMLPS